MEDRQIQNLKKELESGHINFLIGSGASMPFLNTLNDLESSITAIDNLVDDKESLKLLKASIYKEYLENCLFGNLLFNIRNIEEYKEPCAEGKKGKCDEFIQVKKAYDTFIKTINNIVSVKDIELISKQVNIFTTNVDIFIEDALERNRTIFNDGFSGRRNILFDTVNFHNSVFKRSSHYEYTSEQPLFNLFKIHGSLNWEKGEDLNKSEYEVLLDSRLSNLEELNELITENPSYFESYKDVSDFCEIEDMAYLDKLDLGEDRIEKITDFLDLYSKIVMVNPTKRKFEDTTKNLHYYEMLRLYSNHLERENSILFVLGFSFSDEHILRITQRVAKSNPTLTIYVLCSKNSVSSFKEKFHSFTNVRYLTPDEGFYSLERFNDDLLKILKSIPEG